jgi:DNA-directed RNA polymerase subunit K/omega
MTKNILIDFKDIMHDYDPTKNTTTNRLSRYEKAKIIGLRMEQLARGAPSALHIEDVSTQDAIRKIAEKELERRLIPFVIVRTLPNGMKEHWRIEDLIV